MLRVVLQGGFGEYNYHGRSIERNHDITKPISLPQFKLSRYPIMR